MDKHLINEIVDKVVRERINEILMLEYAIDRKAFINRVWNLSPMLISHWCLIRHNRLVKCDDYIDHWKRELLGWMEAIQLLKLKGKNDVESRQKALSQAFNDIEYTTNPKVVKGAIRRKFHDEQIDINLPIIDEIISGFMSDIPQLINLMANDDVQPMREYINSL